MPLLEGPECSLFVEVIGTGEPVSVFVHGVTGSLEEVAPLAERTPGTRVLLDLRGHGRSAAPADIAYDHAAMARDVGFVADHFGASRALGQSMGAGALLHQLCERPERFERIALYIPASIDAPNPTAESLFPWLASLIEEKTLDEIAETTLSSPEMLPRFQARPWVRDFVRARTARIHPTGAPRALRGYLQGPPPVHDATLLARVTAPVLIVANEGDALHDAAVARRLSELLPNSELHVWPEPMAMFDEPGAFAGLVGAWFA